MDTLQKTRFFLILGIAIGNATCTQQERSTRLIEKNIADISSRIHLASNQTDKMLILNSSGGRTSVSLLLSDLIISNNISITVTKECLSNCAEILLPSAKEIRFKNSPIIGFHGNMQSYKDFVQRYAEQTPSIAIGCTQIKY